MLSLANTDEKSLWFISFCFPLTQGPHGKGNCCQILACQRQTILHCMTEGRLNHILDVLRSQQTLSRMDYESITSYPTVTGRARALLDTCLCLGERAAQAVVTALSVSKCSPLGQVIHCPNCPSKVNRLLLWLTFSQPVVGIWAIVICDGKDSHYCLTIHWLKATLPTAHYLSTVVEKANWIKRSSQPLPTEIAKTGTTNPDLDLRDGRSAIRARQNSV